MLPGGGVAPFSVYFESNQNIHLGVHGVVSVVVFGLLGFVGRCCMMVCHFRSGQKLVQLLEDCFAVCCLLVSA